MAWPERVQAILLGVIAGATIHMVLLVITGKC